MTHHPLSAVHILICEHAQPAVLLKHPEVFDQNHELWVLIRRDIKEARVEFLNRFVHVAGIDSLRATVHTYQVTCISLLNRLNEYQTLTEQSVSTKTKVKALCERYADVQILLTEELYYLQMHYSLFFDRGQPVPVCIWQKKQKEWGDLLPLLHQTWAEAGAEPELVQLLFSSLRKQIENTLYPCYEEQAYLDNLPAETEMTDAPADPSPTQLLIFILCRNNYNHPLFTHFLSQQLQAGVPEDSSPGEQADYWALHLKRYQGLYSCDAKWLPQLPPVNKTMRRLIRQELLFCERRMKNSVSSVQMACSVTAEAPQPIVTNLSVGQLAVMMRLLVDCGMIQCANQSELLKRIAACVVTTKQNKISAESLRVKYYAPDAVALSITNEYIGKMMAMMRKY